MRSSFRSRPHPRLAPARHARARTDRFRLHDLVRQFCDGKLTVSQRDAAQLRHARYYRDVFKGAIEVFKSYLRSEVSGNKVLLESVPVLDGEWVNLKADLNWLWKRRDRESNVVLISVIEELVWNVLLRLRRPQLIILAWREHQLEAARIAKTAKLKPTSSEV